MHAKSFAKVAVLCVKTCTYKRSDIVVVAMPFYPMQLIHSKIYSYLKEGSFPLMFMAATMLQSSAMRLEYPASLSYLSNKGKKRRNKKR
jgi:hypothetical protein